MTPYRMAVLTNMALEIEGLPKISGQMIYNYVGKGFIPSDIVDGKLDVTEEDADEWIASYIARKLSKTTTAVKAEVLEEVLENLEEA